MEKEQRFSKEEIHALSVMAVNQLIADVEAKRLLGNQELAETIALCLRHSSMAQLRNLAALLDQHELEGIPAWNKENPEGWINQPRPSVNARKNQTRIDHLDLTHAGNRAGRGY
jgi:hypothetical protein